MRTSDPRWPPPPAPVAHVGALLRDWRSTRRLSQLDLAIKADVSTRHLSFMETGRSQPSREMIARLADALEVPLRERNTLLVAAGYAPGFHETGLTAPAMAKARRAIEFILKQQEPFPAFVVTRHWDLLMSNRGAARLFGLLNGRRSRSTNVMRSVFDPAALRPAIVNWEEVAGDLIRHLHNEVAAAPWDRLARDLLNDVLSYPGVPSRFRARVIDAPATPLLTAVYRKADRELRFFSTITTFGTPQDVTLEELRIECTFPADDTTAAFCRELAQRR